MQNAQALIGAAGRGELNTIEHLLTDGVDVNAPNDHGETALIRAASHGQADVIKLLLARGADPNAKGAEGMTALIRAALCGHAEAAQLLLARGAERAAKDRFGSTALDWALAKGHDEIASLLTGNAAQNTFNPANRVTAPPREAIAPHASPFAFSTQTRLAASAPEVTAEPEIFVAPPPPPAVETIRTTTTAATALPPPSPPRREAPEPFIPQPPARSSWVIPLTVFIFLLVSGAVVAALVINLRRPAANPVQPALNTALATPAAPPTPQPTEPAPQAETTPPAAPAADENNVPAELTAQPSAAVLATKPAPSVLTGISAEKLRGRNAVPSATPIKRRRTTPAGDAVLLDSNGEPVGSRNEAPAPTPAPRQQQQQQQRVIPTRDTEVYRPAPVATAPPAANLPDSRKKKVIQWP